MQEASDRNEKMNDHNSVRVSFILNTFFEKHSRESERRESMQFEERRDVSRKEVLRKTYEHTVK